MKGMVFILFLGTVVTAIAIAIYVLPFVWGVALIVAVIAAVFDPVSNDV